MLHNWMEQHQKHLQHHEWHHGHRIRLFETDPRTGIVYNHYTSCLTADLAWYMKKKHSFTGTLKDKRPVIVLRDGPEILKSFSKKLLRQYSLKWNIVFHIANAQFVKAHFDDKDIYFYEKTSVFPLRPAKIKSLIVFASDFFNKNQDTQWHKLEKAVRDSGCVFQSVFIVHSLQTSGIGLQKLFKSKLKISQVHLVPFSAVMNLGTHSDTLFYDSNQDGKIADSFFDSHFWMRGIAPLREFQNKPPDVLVSKRISEFHQISIFQIK